MKQADGGPFSGGKRGHFTNGIYNPCNKKSGGVIPIGLKSLGIDIGDSFSLNSGSISVTRIEDKDQTKRKVKKYAAEKLQGWPYPADSEMK
ncbi:MAG: hypothetical protein AAB403_05935, partial [Planctomycetota bacterium]